MRSASAIPRLTPCLTGRRNGYCALQPLQDAPRVVDRAVVDDDDFVPLWRGREGSARLLHEQREILRFVLGGNENADFGPACRRLRDQPP